MHIINGLSFGYLHLLFNEVCINNVTQEKKYAAFDWIARLKTRLKTNINNYLVIEQGRFLYYSVIVQTSRFLKNKRRFNQNDRTVL